MSNVYEIRAFNTKDGKQNCFSVRGFKTEEDAKKAFEEALELIPESSIVRTGPNRLCQNPTNQFHRDDNNCNNASIILALSLS